MKTYFQIHFFNPCLFLILFFCCSLSFAKDNMMAEQAVFIKDAWVRPTNPGQEVGAAYMTLLSTVDLTLVKIDSDITKNIQIHSMSMSNGVMKMRRLDTLQLSAGIPFKLAPGELHLMLFDLKKPLKVGQHVNFLLLFKKKNKIEFKQKLMVMIQSSLEESLAK